MKIHVKCLKNKTIYLCTFSCLCNESKLYVVKSQKQHTKAFNVWTCLMWLSNPLLETLTTSHWGHLYLYEIFPPPTILTWIVIEDSGPPSLTGVIVIPLLPLASPSPSSPFVNSSSIFTTSFIIRVGVTLILMLFSNCGSLPIPACPTAFSNIAQPSAIIFSPSATIWCPIVTVLTATMPNNNN